MGRPEAAIEVQDLTVVYPLPRPLRRWLRPRGPQDAVRALDRVSLAAAPGEVLGLLGPNGAGKTTLIHVLCTLLAPSAGAARVAGCDVVRSPELVRRQVGLVTSNERSFYWRLSGRQNLRFFADLFAVPRADVEPRCDELLDALDLREWADRRFEGYSTGIRQRFAFARALLHRPRILFMDEPTKGLDPNAAAALLQLIRERILELWRPTVFITSHNLTEIEALCDSVAILDEGRLLRFGTLAELARSVRRHETYRLQIAGADRKLVEGLRRLLGAQHVREREGPLLSLDLALGQGERDLSSALRYVLDHGGEIRRCEPVEVSLADVFRHTVRSGSSA
jgi:ABC-2 type transport system ATP-binding protein